MFDFNGISIKKRFAYIWTFDWNVCLQEFCFYCFVFSRIFPDDLFSKGKSFEEILLKSDLLISFLETFQIFPLNPYDTYFLRIKISGNAFLYCLRVLIYVLFAQVLSFAFCFFLPLMMHLVLSL